MTACTEVALPYARAATIYHVHHIVGRSRRHGTARHVALRRSLAELHGCRAPSGNMATLVRSAAHKSVPALAAMISVTAGSGVIGGFGPMHGIDPIPSCITASCRLAVPLQEPFSVGLLGIATLLMVIVHGLRRRRAHAR